MTKTALRRVKPDAYGVGDVAFLYSLEDVGGDLQSWVYGTAGERLYLRNSVASAALNNLLPAAQGIAVDTSGLLKPGAFIGIGASGQTFAWDAGDAAGTFHEYTAPVGYSKSVPIYFAGFIYWWEWGGVPIDNDPANPDFRLCKSTSILTDVEIIDTVRIGPRLLTGTLSITADTDTVTGSGTLFLSEVQSGDQLMIAGEQITVASVTTDTSLRTVTHHVAGASGVTVPNLIPNIVRYPVSGLFEGGPGSIFVSATGPPAPHFTTELVVGDTLVVNGEWHTVAVIDSDELLRLTAEPRATWNRIPGYVPMDASRFTGEQWVVALTAGGALLEWWDGFVGGTHEEFHSLRLQCPLDTGQIALYDMGAEDVDALHYTALSSFMLPVSGGAIGFATDYLGAVGGLSRIGPSFSDRPSRTWPLSGRFDIVTPNPAATPTRSLSPDGLVLYAVGLAAIGSTLTAVIAAPGATGGDPDRVLTLGEMTSTGVIVPVVGEVAPGSGP